VKEGGSKERGTLNSQAQKVKTHFGNAGTKGIFCDFFFNVANVLKIKDELYVTFP